MPSPTRNSEDAGDWSVEDAFDQGKSAVGDAAGLMKSGALIAWSKTTRRMRAVGGIIVFTCVTAVSVSCPDRITDPVGIIDSSLLPYGDLSHLP
jgi:hypothetical protein